MPNIFLDIVLNALFNYFLIDYLCLKGTYFKVHVITDLNKEVTHDIFKISLEAGSISTIVTRSRSRTPTNI